mgnify:CR=1 FL=1
MIIQFFGMDVASRNLASKAFANESKSFYCTDRELPMASLEAQFARWLRTICGVAHKNGMPNIVLSGYFPSKESRQQFKEGMEKTIDWYLSNSEWIANVTSGSYKQYYNEQYVNR